jgi:hypothetical protein
MTKRTPDEIVGALLDETVENAEHRPEPEVWEEVVDRLCWQRHGGPWTRSPNRFDEGPGPGTPSTLTRDASRYRVVSTALCARLTHTHARGASVRKTAIEPGCAGGAE